MHCKKVTSAAKGLTLSILIKTTAALPRREVLMQPKAVLMEALVSGELISEKRGTDISVPLYKHNS